MLSFLLSQPDTLPSELPTLSKLAELLAAENDAGAAADGTSPAGLTPRAAPTPDQLSDGDAPAAAPLRAADAASSSTPVDVVAHAPSGRAGPATTLELLLSPAVCGGEGLQAPLSFPSLTLLTQQLAADDKDAGSGSNAAAVPPPLPKNPPLPAAVTEAPQDVRDRGSPIPRAATASLHENDSAGGPEEEAAAAAAAPSPPPAEVPFCIPVPVVPGAGDWTGTRTVTVAPPPLPVAPAAPAVTVEEGVTDEEEGEEGEESARSATVPDTAEATRTFSSEVPVAAGAPNRAVERLREAQRRGSRPQHSPLSTAVLALADGPQPAPQPATASRPADRHIAGRLPRNVAEVLRQRRSPTPSTPASAAPPRRPSFIDRYMEGLYARAASSTAPVSGPSSGRSAEPAAAPADEAPTPSRRRESLRAAVDYDAVASHLLRSAEHLYRPNARRSSSGTRPAGGVPPSRRVSSGGVQPLLRGRGGSAPRYSYDRVLQQYQQLPRLPTPGGGRGTRPVSSPMPRPSAEAPPAPAPNPVAPLSRFRTSHLAGTPVARSPSSAERGGVLDLAIVGSRIALPSPVSNPPNRCT